MKEAGVAVGLDAIGRVGGAAEGGVEGVVGRIEVDVVEVDGAEGRVDLEAGDGAGGGPGLVHDFGQADGEAASEVELAVAEQVPAAVAEEGGDVGGGPLLAGDDVGAGVGDEVGEIAGAEVLAVGVAGEDAEGGAPLLTGAPGVPGEAEAEDGAEDDQGGDGEDGEGAAAREHRGGAEGDQGEGEEPAGTERDQGRGPPAVGGLVEEEPGGEEEREVEPGEDGEGAAEAAGRRARGPGGRRGDDEFELHAARSAGFQSFGTRGREQFTEFCCERVGGVSRQLASWNN
jgi:hypothetical protein